MSNIRLGPWDLNRELYDQMEAIKVREGKTWRFMLTEGCRMFIASRGMVPHTSVVRESYAPAPNVERPPNPASVYAVPVVSAAPASVVSAAPASVVSAAPASVVSELTENEKILARLHAGRARKQALLDEAPRELEREPGSLRALNWLKVMPGILASYDADIAEWTAKVEAEKAAKENSGEVLPGVEV